MIMSWSRSPSFGCPSVSVICPCWSDIVLNLFL
jgi:hypothetical protein